MMDIIITSLLIVFGICILGLCLYGLFKKCKERRKEIILEWLLLAVVKAEKELGDGTGQIKLRFVYDLFIDKFKFMAMIISFSQFSALVDMALDTMKNIVSNNKQVQNYIQEK